MPRALPAVLIALSVLCLPQHAFAQERDHILGLGVDLYWDDGTHHLRQVNRGPDLLEQDEDVSSDKLFAVSLRYMTRLLEHVQIGGSLRYFGTYTYAPEEDDDDVYALGQLIELAGQAEYVVPIIAPLDVLLGAQAGLALLFPSGDLGRDLDDLDGDGFNVWGVPRLGYVVGPQLGARYRINEWLAVRGDFSVLWTQLFLVDASAESGGLTGETTRRLGMWRKRLAVAVELMF